MSGILAVTGLTGKKSGGAFAQYISDNIDEINLRFPRGIRALVRQTSNIDYLKENIPSVELCIGDLTDIDYLKKALDSVDTFVHIAGIQYSTAIVDAAVHCRVRRLILVHTTGVYSKFKSAGEQYKLIDTYVSDVCKQNSIILTICRPTMIYGNMHDNNVVKFIKMVDKFPIMPVVNGARYELQPVHFKDLAKAYFDILMNEEATANKDYNLSGGQPIMLRDMLTIIGKNLGKDVKFISCPFPIAYTGAWIVYCLTFGKKDFREKVQRFCEPRTFTHDEAKKDFGYAPVIFEVGIIDEVKEYLAKNNKNKKHI